MALDRLAADLAELRNTRPRYFTDWLAAADPEDARNVMEAIMDTRISANKLANTLQGHKIPITRETIVKYRDARR